MSSLSRRILETLLPKGSAWVPAKDEDYDKFLKGQALNIDPMITYLSSLADIRNPLKTNVLDELEKEYGVTKNDNFTEQQRRDFLAAFISSVDNNGSEDDLETRLNDAGFPVQIHQNDPASDPNVILDQNFQMIANWPHAVAGNEDAYASRIGGELIVNGDQFEEMPDFLNVAGGANAFAGNESFGAGEFDTLISIKIEYKVPDNPSAWPFMFYIGGDAIRDLDDKIIEIERIILPIEERNEFLKIILQYKPLYTWGISVVDFV